MSSTSSIPTSNAVTESAVIDAQLSEVWHFIKLQDFARFWTKLQSSEYLKGTSDEADVVKWTFKDGTIVEVKQEEHSTINHYISYSTISSDPALTYTAVVSTIRLYPVTSGEHEGKTFITWSGNFSSDADAGVIEDAKFKRREALADLAQAVTKLHK
ncbi:Bet v1-like protein [Delitschia confertaspora ATCC 74209]|uniref:Bet v1-like protein n=1 Tax=Delitschia confertaspora ATCC 74209 TaxID=1513339 RepID=A0A9P4MZ39_9PLEO|nr:Bet v1-like protein [Delitschia confertaspora ATCC 74209]